MSENYLHMQSLELTGEALNYAVAKAIGHTNILIDFRHEAGGQRYGGIWLGTEDGLKTRFNPVRSWYTGGPMVEALMREGMLLQAVDPQYRDRMPAFKATFDGWETTARGHTPLECAARLAVYRRFGALVDVPERLLS